MLKRAISAPADYATPGILRYTSEPFSTTSYNVKFAPLPETESFGRRHQYKLGVSGRSGILRRQRATRGGINYDPNNAEIQLDSDSTVQQNGDANATEGAKAETDDDTPIPELPLLRRSVSEDGMSTQAASKRAGNGWGFWRKHSKRPALPTITSQKESPHSALSPTRSVETGGEPSANGSDMDSALIEASPIIILDNATENSGTDESANSPRSLGASPSPSPPETPQEHVSLEEVQVTTPESLEHSEKSAATQSEDAVGSTLDSKELD